MNILKWQNNQKVFLVDKSQNYTYADLYVAVASLISTLPQKKDIWFQATHQFSAYARLIALWINKNRVFLVSSRQYEDRNYRQWVEEQSQVILHDCVGSDPIDEFKKVKVLEHKLDDSKFVIRTSGSSGKKYKLVEHQLAGFKLKYKMRGDHFERTMAFSPAETIAGVETLLEVLTLEKTLITTRGELAPNVVVSSLIDNKVDYFQTTPTYMNLLLVSSELVRLKNAHLKKIAFGSEPSQDKVLKGYRQELAEVELIHTYGMSEVGILDTITNQEDARFWKLKSQVNPGLIHNGILAVKSQTKMLRYLNAIEESNGLGLEWFSTGDIAEEKDGFFRVLGRKDDLINLAGRKFYPSELEEKFRDIPEIKDVTVTTEANDFLGIIIILHIVLDDQTDESQFRIELKNIVMNG